MTSFPHTLLVSSTVELNFLEVALDCTDLSLKGKESISACRMDVSTIAGNEKRKGITGSLSS